ncbi:MAG: DEAD/DEAH box helicase [Gemmatimonadota bacterium]
MTTFRALGLPALLTAALAEQGIEEPFAIQARALPDALAGRDVLGRAQTGSGKTLAFGLPMLARLAAGGRAGAGAPRGLVLVPTRELAKQVANVLEPLGEALGVTVTTVYGGASMNVQISRLRRGVDIVVATPGRLIDLLDRGSCTLRQISVTVLDEADHMADLGFFPAVTRILDETPPGGQRLLFSATLDRDVERLVTGYLADPALHAVAPVTDVATAADHQVFVLPAADKLAVAAELAGRPDRTLFFVRTKHGADRLARQLTKGGTPAAAIHGNLNQNQRHRALASFTEGHPRVLVATDVAARGLHIDDVGLVVHYDPPHDHKDYLHRSGRTARAGATGTVVALVDPAQASDVAKLHDAAGVTPSRHQVEAGHPAVREVATAGTPIPPPPPRPAAAAPAGRPARSGGRPAHGRPAGDRPAAGRKPRGARPDRPAREDRPARPDRPVRGDRPVSWDRPARDGRPGREDRPARGDRQARPARSAGGNDRPAWENRPARSARPSRGGGQGRRSGVPSRDRGRS